MQDDIKKIKALLSPALLLILIGSNSVFLISENGNLLNLQMNSTFKGFIFAGALEASAFALCMMKNEKLFSTIFRMIGILGITIFMICGATLFGQSHIIEKSVLAETDILKLKSIEQEIKTLTELHGKNLAARQKANAGFNNQQLTEYQNMKSELLKNMAADPLKKSNKTFTLGYILIGRIILQCVNLLLFFGFKNAIKKINKKISTIETSYYADTKPPVDCVSEIISFIKKTNKKTFRQISSKINSDKKTTEKILTDMERQNLIVCTPGKNIWENGYKLNQKLQIVGGKNG